MAFDFASISVPFRMQPGLRRLAPGAPQLTPNAPGDRALREKLAVLGAYAPQALLSTPGFDAAPALLALSRKAADEHPSAWSHDASSQVHAHWLGWSLQGPEVRQHNDTLPEVGTCLRALPPEWRLPALLCLAFAEDFAVIDGQTAHIPWLAVCLPSGWAPEEKIGRHFAHVHAPVADNQLLVTAGEHLARLVTGDDRWERFVWTITRHPRLHAHPNRKDSGPWPADATPDEVAHGAFFRTERQTFIPLPSLRQAVFTIHVELQPLAQALANPAQAKSVHDALASMSPAVLAYRGLADARDRLLAWLASRSGA
ncbi:MAG TPA: heme-dependent oxidative N-demethylase subunit alpha family protein [Rhizobacter sp.]|nr:heme-dependent oxidative N-demethylase subunit alpha family protein [Rhizobacter sp.]